MLMATILMGEKTYAKKGRRLLKYNKLLFLQEVILDDCHDIPGYTAYKNVGKKGRGPAILTRRIMTLTKREILPTEGEIAAPYQQTPLNISAPSGSSNGMERGNFSNTELVYLLRHLPHNYIFGGDFNCVLSPLNYTGGFRACKTLQAFVKNPHFIDFGANTFNRAIFTNYRPIVRLGLVGCAFCTFYSRTKWVLKNRPLSLLITLLSLC
jgi:hypothetical protein